MSETLSNLGTSKVDADERTNVVGEMTAILAFIPNDGIELEVYNGTEGVAGIPLYIDLRDSNDDPLPLDTRLAIRWDAPHLDQPKVVSETLDNIRQYVQLSITQQQNEDYRDRTRVELQGRSLVVEDVEEMQVAIESSAQIDWSNSRLYVDEKAAETRSGA